MLEIRGDSESPWRDFLQNAHVFRLNTRSVAPIASDNEVVGDPLDPEVLLEAIKQSGGNFDVSLLIITCNYSSQVASSVDGLPGDC